MKQLALYDDGTTPLALGPSLTEQAARWPMETQVMVDGLVHLGWRFEALDDLQVEARRLTAAGQHTHLWMTREVKARGTRRAWYRPARGNETGWFIIGGRTMTFIAYEPRLEKQLGAKTKGTTDHERAKRTHWPKGATP